jgi:hypothetical protein
MTGTLVDFMSSTGQTLTASSSGQAKITTTDNSGNLTSVDVTSPLHAFTDFIVNLHDLEGSATITVTTNDGITKHVLSGGPGQIFITIVAQNKEKISSVDFASTAGFDQFQQPRISGLVTIPESSTWVMLSLGLIGLGFAASRRRKRESIF